MQKGQHCFCLLAKKQLENYEKSDDRRTTSSSRGCPHLMMAADGWDEIAQQIEGWITSVLTESHVESEITST